MGGKKTRGGPNRSQEMPIGTLFWGGEEKDGQGARGEQADQVRPQRYAVPVFTGKKGKHGGGRQGKRRAKDCAKRNGIGGGKIDFGAGPVEGGFGEEKGGGRRKEGLRRKGGRSGAEHSGSQQTLRGQKTGKRWGWK